MVTARAFRGSAGTPFQNVTTTTLWKWRGDKLRHLDFIYCVQVLFSPGVSWIDATAPAGFHHAQQGLGGLGHVCSHGGVSSCGVRSNDPPTTSIMTPALISPRNMEAVATIVSTSSRIHAFSYFLLEWLAFSRFIFACSHTPHITTVPNRQTSRTIIKKVH